MIICANTPLEGALLGAEKVRREASVLRVPVGDGFWVGSISVGAAVRLLDMNSAEALLKAADEGVYVVKASGRDCIASVQSTA